MFRNSLVAQLRPLGVGDGGRTQRWQRQSLPLKVTHSPAGKACLIDAGSYTYTTVKEKKHVMLPSLLFKTVVHLLADGTHKASGMVGLAQDCHHLPLHELAAVVAQCAVEPLEVQRAEVVAAPHEEATLSQVAATHCVHMCKEETDLTEILRTRGFLGLEATVMSCRSGRDLIDLIQCCKFDQI